MTAQDAAVRPFLDALAEAVAEAVLRDLAATKDQTTTETRAAGIGRIQSLHRRAS